MSSSKINNYDKLFTNDDFEFGEIYYIKDELITMPETDRRAIRELKPGRMVVIVHDTSDNSDEECPFLTVAPISTKTELKLPNDILIEPNDVKENDGVTKSSKICIYLQQPILKVDLERKVGILNQNKLDELLFAQLDLIGCSDLCEDNDDEEED